MLAWVVKFLYFRLVKAVLSTKKSVQFYVHRRGNIHHLCYHIMYAEITRLFPYLN